MSSGSVLLVIGNPLLDISTEVQPNLLDKYELKNGNAILAEPKHIPLYQELVTDYPIEYIPGGAGQNTARCFQWMYQQPNASHYIGCIGSDNFGTLLQQLTTKDGVSTHYLVDKEAPTGTCAVLICQKERSLVANLGAANNYKKSHFDSAEIQQIVQSVSFFYITGFFLTVSPETMVAVGEHAVANNKTFLINLSAPFLIDFFWDKMSSVLPYADVIFANENEAQAFGKKQGWPEDLVEIGQRLAVWEKKNTAKPRTVVFTQGSKETLVFVAHENGSVELSSFYPQKLEASQIVDTNGAGDSFVGGFLSEYVKGSGLEKAVSAGHWCASQIIQTSGCKFNGKPTWSFE